MIAVGVLTFLYVLLRFTWLGRAIRAVSENVSSARLVGVNPKKVAALTFAVGVAMAGAEARSRPCSTRSSRARTTSGSHASSGSSSSAGWGLPGAVIGALALGVAETMTATYISPRWATMMPYALIIVVLLARPQGIMGAKLREDAVV